MGVKGEKSIIKTKDIKLDLPSDKVLFTGVQNYNNGLYDIPVQKNYITIM